MRADPSGTSSVATEPTFSIVVPVHNYGRYISATLDSVLRQNRDDVEIIVVNDASTDDSSNIAKSYGSPVSVIDLDVNVGPAAAWWRGLEEAKGRYICKLDADDWQLPGFLDRVESAFEQDERIGIVATSSYLYIEPSQRVLLERITSTPQLLPERQLRRELLRKFFVRMPATALRRDVVIGAAPPRNDLRLPHDWEFFLRVLRDWRGYLVPEPLAVYRVHEGSLTLTSTQRNRLREDMRRLLEVVRDPAEPGAVEPDEFGHLSLGAAEAYLGTVGPQLALTDLGRAASHVSFAIRLAAHGGLVNVLGVFSYLAYGLYRRWRRRTGDVGIPVSDLLPSRGKTT